MPPRTHIEYYQAKESFVTMLNGEQTQVSAGDLVHPDHPILKGREHLFRKAKDHVRFNVVEQATAAPGERRGA